MLFRSEPVAWGPTNEALCDENLLRARAMVEAFDRDAEICEV